MTVTLPALSGVVLVYLLVFARTGAMIMLLPPIGDTNVPGRVRGFHIPARNISTTPVSAS